MIRNRSKLLALAAVSAVLALTGCASEAEPPKPPTMTEAEKTAAYLTETDTQWESVLERFPDAFRPDVDLVRYIQPNEWSKVMASCLSDAGIEATISEDGGIETSTPVGQEEPHAIAWYVCQAKYPGDPELAQPLTSAELEYLYNYLVNDLTPCLEAEGYKVDDPPSLQTYTDTYLTADAWTPYSSVLGAGGQESWNKINRKCPQNAPGLRE